MILNMCSLQGLKGFPDHSFDSIVTDPPYELGFMGKSWDASGIAYNVELWRECLRVLKPGGHLLAFSGSRTYHRMTCAIEDAGFEIRDQIQWIYGSGFPKSLDVSKAIDKANGKHGRDIKPFADDITAPATEAAKQWNGWGTALKPAHEPIAVARKPLVGTVAANVLQFGTGAINVDGCRVAATGERLGGGGEKAATFAGKEGYDRPWMHDSDIVARHAAKVSANVERASELGRWPANVIHDGSDEVRAAFPNAGGQRGAITGDEPSSQTNIVYGEFNGRPASSPRNEIDKSAARFFYCAKASKADRDEGLDAFTTATPGELTGGRSAGSAGLNSPRAGAGRTEGGKNIHPTVKPTDLMRYLCRLVTPPGGVVLDPFAGSGSTGKAAILEGFHFIGFELDPEYAKIAKSRIDSAVNITHDATK